MTTAGYVVTAHVVTVKLDEAPPHGLGYVYRGSYLPGNTKRESVEHLLALGMIRPVDELEMPR